MNVPHKFVKTLSEDERNKLIANHQHHRKFRVRQRSHAILLSAEGANREQIARICRVHRETVSLWINAWNKGGWEALEDAARAGRPKVLCPAEEAQAVEIALRNPRFPARQIEAIKAELGKTSSA